MIETKWIEENEGVAICGGGVWVVDGERVKKKKEEKKETGEICSVDMPRSFYFI